MDAEEVRVVFRKYDGRPHRDWTMTRLGQDRHGVWLGAPAGATVHTGEGTASFIVGYPSVRLIPPGSWWTALFTAVPDEWDVYCDITTPARWTGTTEVTLVDLDLDLDRARARARARADRSVHLLDEDEFDAHRTLFGYADEFVVTVTGTAAHLRTAIAHSKPFASRYMN